MDAPPSLHPTDQALSSYGLGKLDDGQAEAVNRHLEDCPACRKRVAEMSSDSFLGRVRDAQKGSGTLTPNPFLAGVTLSQKGGYVSSPPRADTLPPGLADHPDYEIKRELGRGGMGVVYLAHNTLMGRDEVLKVMGRQIIERPGVLDRFLREIRAVARLRHANIVTAYSATRIGENIVFAMEYVEGLDLSKMVKAKGPLPVSHACHFVYQAALGLQHAHEEGLVHRDIKPANLMLTRKGDRATVKVLDFGLAKVAREEKVDGGLTSQGQALGTPDYIAPEQILDAPSADIRADIYSLGGTLYYLLTGRAPFKATSLYDLYQAHISRDADPLNLVRPEVPSELAALVAKMMAKDPARRFQTPGEVARALTPFFKKGSLAFKGPLADVSQFGPLNAGRLIPGGVSTPTQPATDAGGLAVPAVKAVAPTVAEGRWESLIDIRETESSAEATPAADPVRRLPWVWPSVAVGVLTFGLLAASLGGVFKVKTPDGVIVLENVPRDSEIYVDGGKITFIWPGIGQPVEIRAVPGQRKVEVKKNGFKTFGEVVTLKTDESEEVTVRLEPLFVVRPTQNEGAAGGTGGLPTRAVGTGKPRVGKPPVPPAVTPDRDNSMTNSLGMNLKLIPAGEFLMGSPDSDKDANDDEKPRHRVRITRPFYLGVTEVTQGQYRGVTGENPSWFKGSDDLPVESVLWDDAIAFCNKLSACEGLKPYYQLGAVAQTVGNGYRLPTEAEWEYACRGGTSTRYSFGDDAASLGEYAWFTGNSGGKTHPVGQKRPNAFGLHDMSGNVWEWCWDGYKDNYYQESPAADPSGPSINSARVIRGGSWGGKPRLARSAFRNRYAPGDRSMNLGFRLARSQSGQRGRPSLDPGSF